jgi:hypothetical protein
MRDCRLNLVAERRLVADLVADPVAGCRRIGGGRDNAQSLAGQPADA